jgi:hypothetical protein
MLPGGKRTSTRSALCCIVRATYREGHQRLERAESERQAANRGGPTRMQLEGAQASEVFAVVLAPTATSWRVERWRRLRTLLCASVPLCSRAPGIIAHVCLWGRGAHATSCLRREGVWTGDGEAGSTRKGQRPAGVRTGSELYRGAQGWRSMISDRGRQCRHHHSWMCRYVCQ